jgi:hypothetical protein
MRLSAWVSRGGLRVRCTGCTACALSHHHRATAYLSVGIDIALSRRRGRHHAELETAICRCIDGWDAYMSFTWRLDAAQQWPDVCGGNVAPLVAIEPDCGTAIRAELSNDRVALLGSQSNRGGMAGVTDEVARRPANDPLSPYKSSSPAFRSSSRLAIDTPCRCCPSWAQLSA